MFFDSMNVLAAADSGVTGISNLVNNDAATLEEKTQTAKAFFTKDNLRALLEQGINWAIQKGVQLIIAFIIWRLGKIFLKYLLAHHFETSSPSPKRRLAICCIMFMSANGTSSFISAGV